MYIAADSAVFVGGLGAGGLALVLVVAAILGTRKGGDHGLGGGAALALALVAGVVAMGAGKIWGAPDDLISRALKGLVGVDALGEVTYAAVSILLVLVVYFVRWSPRARVWFGLIMATAFSLTGGIWAEATSIIADLAVGVAV
ncbi:hypothetical protein ACWGUP_17715 [Streptomyces diastaticus]|uniref:hypothetical protein n=1 Tax=Streptomyces sp. SID8014 TaxID=2706097 RepID=UPI0013B70E42|nr:hypothetical protein [Streptomyces sp. SID8014]NEC14828.1 hypothetical protein [Streptomyces sp. SID8014]